MIGLMFAPKDLQLAKKRIGRSYRPSVSLFIIPTISTGLFKYSNKFKTTIPGEQGLPQSYGNICEY
jgi:hypothetical protein